MTTNVSKKPVSRTPAVPTVRDPFSLMRDEMNDLISRMWHGPHTNAEGFAMNPAMDVAEEENAYEIRVDAPGVDAEDFDIQIQGNSITISGNRQEEKEEKDKKFHRIERRSGSFSRTIALPTDVNEDEVVAHYADGVLTMTLPKCEKAKVKRVNVKK